MRLLRCPPGGGEAGGFASGFAPGFAGNLTRTLTFERATMAGRAADGAPLFFPGIAGMMKRVSQEGQAMRRPLHLAVTKMCWPHWGS